ncbi:hypothetical protein NG831_00295 [Xanthomonas sacchari]|uniref:hypothetical protein n=1 Tax=Xanthomonas sacchari TaxID=56458 RepID=UPI002259A7AB|nr:hypothetical protein [Xanthomonas sacchari]MCW0410693.1 hypothetical protein [Xanthomonas sacchari]MCW0458303.1 hypothetical protein [Xanthomonas sacchari]UYK66712.1 hypothetical protein NG831_00295 [Xanthomonas sacchari]
MTTFQFQPRWKEELVCTGPGGEFVLDFPMGVPTVYVPTEHAWAQSAPAWARDLWPVFKAELEAWCDERDVQFFLDGSAKCYGATAKA